MSKYTTGEIAKLCNVSVRTVQYYDSRAILIPSELSEGGRRLYSEADLKRMRVICFLRELGLSINSIAELLNSEKPEKVIEILLNQQQQELREDIKSKTEKLKILENIRAELKATENFSIDAICDIASIMKLKKKLRKVHITVVIVGIIMEIIEIATLALWVVKGIWWPFAAGMPLVLAMGAVITAFYYKYTAYICPECHKVFKPSFKDFSFSTHTPKTRKLTCTNCGYKGYCVETYAKITE